MSEKLKVQVLEGADNKLNLAKLEDVLSRKLIIPSYQRPYAWTEEDIEEIFQTIKHTEENEEDISFFGSIILSKKSNGFGQEEYYIIDGQQRLTSFLLILRIILIELDNLLEELTTRENLSEEEIETKIQLKPQKEKLSKIINTVNLIREQSNNDSEEYSLLNFIKKGGDCDNLPNHLKKKADAIYERAPIRYKKEWSASNNAEVFEYIDKILVFVDQILNQIRFCLISITGKNSEDFAINLFNTLNTTGQPLTAFEVLKSEIYKMNPTLSNQINDIQSDIIKKYIFQRKKILTHTGKLLLYLPLYRGDFKETNYTLTDKKFKDQRGYLKEALKPETAGQLVEDIKDINGFYSDYWLNFNDLEQLLNKDDEQVCFYFLSKLNHDRVLPILIRFYKNNKGSLGECAKICAAFSSLWRAFQDGGTAGIDNAYKDLSQDLKKNEIQELNEKLKKLFLKKLKVKKIKELKNKWLEKLKISPIYKNKALSKFLLFIAYNQLHFDLKKGLKKGSGIDILNLHHWQHKDYKTIEHIIPQTERQMIGHIHTLGNLTLLPQALNSSLGDKTFSEKREKYKQFCSTENESKYPYLPIIKHISHYNQFGKKEIEQRSKILSQFIWQTLAEDWLGWKK